MVSPHFTRYAPALVALLVFGVSSVGAAQSKATKDPAVVKNADDKDLKWGPAPAFMPPGTELTVLHGDPAKKNADVLLRVPAKATIAEHWHSSAERMILISGELQINYAGQPPAVMKAGSYAYGPAKAPPLGCLRQRDSVCIVHRLRRACGRGAIDQAGQVGLAPPGIAARFAATS